MTYKQKLLTLSQITAEKAKKVDDIERDFNTDGFHQYSIINYRDAHNAHGDAVNNHGKVISQMFNEGHSLDDDYIEIF